MKRFCGTTGASVALVVWGVDEPVQHTGQLSEARRIAIKFDEGYAGFAASPLRAWMVFA